MDEDKFALAEKILKDVSLIISKNPDLYAFDIVAAENNFQNKSPVLHVENCLGLESWCVKHVFMYCYSELSDIYICKPRRRLSQPSSMNCERLSNLLNITLLINPEVCSLWNKKREMVQRCLLQKDSELRFTKLVLSRKPKCNDAFSYRRWLMELILKDNTVQDYQLENLINEELHICDLASDKIPNNYHSWNHRLWLLSTLKNLRKQFDLTFIYLKEYSFSEKWTSKHVSDYSCFHYRQFCIKNLFSITEQSWIAFENAENVSLRIDFLKILAHNLPEDFIGSSEVALKSCSEDYIINLLLGYSSAKCDCTQNNLALCRKLDVLFHELVLNSELLKFYKYHETLWYHRRFIVHEIIAIVYDHFDLVRQNGALVKNVCKTCNVDERQKQFKIVRYDSNRIYSTALFKVLMNCERKFIEDRQKDSDNYAVRHEKYLKFVEGLNNVF